MNWVGSGCLFDFTSLLTIFQSYLRPLNGICRNLRGSRELNVLYQVCVFSGRAKKKQDGCPDLRLAETFSTSSLTSLNGFCRNLTRSKNSMSSTKFVFFGPIRKNKVAAPVSYWLLHFYNSSGTAKRCLMKLDRMQDLKFYFSKFTFFFWAIENRR